MNWCGGFSKNIHGAAPQDRGISCRVVPSRMHPGAVKVKGVTLTQNFAFPFDFNRNLTFQYEEHFLTPVTDWFSSMARRFVHDN